MTSAQVELYTKLRNKLSRRGIKNIPTVLKVSGYPNNKVFMLIRVLSESCKNFDSWEYSRSFREVCFEKFGSNFTIFKKVEEEIDEVLKYVKQ